MPTTLEREYRRVRAIQIRSQRETGQRSWGKGAALAALNVARDEMALRQAEANDEVRFEWTYDHDYEVTNSGDPEFGDIDEENEKEKLASGEWEALGCIAYLPKKCKECGAVVEDEWEHAASLWGIVIDIDDSYDYKREVERELAQECGVI